MLEAQLGGFAERARLGEERRRAGDVAAPLIDMLANVVGRINVNAQCGRSPDTFPFSGRRSSAMGTMSVSEALRGFSIETVVAYPAASDVSRTVLAAVDAKSAFLSPMGSS